jgi:glutaconate CoA-transferase subunit B
VTADEVVAATGWELQVAGDVGETAAPTDEELQVLRSLKTKGQS